MTAGGLGLLLGVAAMEQERQIRAFLREQGRWLWAFAR